VDKLTHIPYISNQLKVGLAAIVFSTPCHYKWRETKALQAQNPKYYGFDFECKLLS
jgi:DUF917 family protein